MSTPDKLSIQEEDGTVNEYDILDLHDLALLLNFERYTREPRFRRSKLLDVARGEQDMSNFPITLPAWRDPKLRAKRNGFMFRIEDNVPYDEDALDLPSNMLPAGSVPPRIKALEPAELETIFYQARAHDSCFATIALLQYLFALYDAGQPIRVRTDAGTEFITQISARHTATFTLRDPKSMTLSIVGVGNPLLRHTSYISGDEASMAHCAMVFLAPAKGSDLAIRGSPPRDGVVLDLASMQFGDAGRGARGKGLFVLEPMDNYVARMLTVAADVDDPTPGGLMLERQELLWLKDVARRVKERYDRRETHHWCGHCGAPAQRKVCKCKTAWYCDEGHQNAAWPFHKHYCSARQKK